MQKDKNELALLRCSIIAPLVNGTYEEGTLAEYVQKAGEKTYLLKEMTIKSHVYCQKMQRKKF